MPHPTQIFLSNPQALRLEYRLDEARLELWWSPLAGRSTDCADRNYSHRDAHLDVFEAIHLPGCELKHFRSCDYDPYHTVLHFEKQTLHLVMAPDAPAVLLEAEAPQVVELKTARFDRPLRQDPGAFAVRHEEPRHAFVFAAATGEGNGSLRHSPVQTPENPRFVRAELAAGQPLVLAAGLEGDDTPEGTRALARAGKPALLESIEARLAPSEAAGRIHSESEPALAALRRKVVRGLHSMIDESGAYRASLKAIYYLIWVRDAGFSFAYQAAAGWPHKLPELCRLLLDNPLQLPATDGEPHRRMFGQLVNRHFGKREEDGLYYVVWTLFTHWTQFGHLDFMSDEDWALLDEALETVEAATWDAGRGLYGEFFADETPAHGSPDHGWDLAVGKATGGRDHIRVGGEPVTRNYDVYFNLCMHGTHTMLAAIRGEARHLDLAERVWPELEKLLRERHDGIPVYGEVLLRDGDRRSCPHWGPARSCCVWRLTMPGFAPLDDWESVRAALLDALAEAPGMHFMNGICSALSAVDTWFYPEEKALALHRRIAGQTERPGRYLPMGGAMPEKFDAPEGNLYHDIRPQGFAMGAWLAAWCSLGLRRLPYGLALRPTRAFDAIEAYPWRGRELHFDFGPTGTALALEIDGHPTPGTLQLPEAGLRPGTRRIRLVPGQDGPLWLDSTVRLDEVRDEGQDGLVYEYTAHGAAEIRFHGLAGPPSFDFADGPPPEVASTTCGETSVYRFRHFGKGRLRLESTRSSRGNPGPVPS